MTDLKDLIAKCERATGGDRELDAAIATALDDWSEHWEAEDLHSEPKLFKDCDDYTSSIDAALALCERVLPGIWYVLAKGRLQASEPLFGCEMLFGSDEQIAIADGPTQALAIVIATLKALEKDSAE